jgi:hypothetical protein
MNIKAARRALIVAAGLWLCFSAPTQAAEEADGAGTQAESAGPPVMLNKFRKSGPARHAARHARAAKIAAGTWKRSASSAQNRTFRKTEVANADSGPDLGAANLPASVANANAQLADAVSAPDSAMALSSQARDRLQMMAANAPEPPAASTAEAEVVEPDQLNDIDRALAESRNEARPALAPTVSMAMAQAPAAISNGDSAWDQTSLIGKIFSAFGALLTLASAARMLMA